MEVRGKSLIGGGWSLEVAGKPFVGGGWRLEVRQLGVTVVVIPFYH